MKKIFTFILALVASVGISSAAITVRLDSCSCSSWSTVRLWAWTDEGNVFDSWPGQIVSSNGDGWYAYTFSSSITSVSIIWTNGTDQTVDITGVTSSTCYKLNNQTGKAITVSVVDCSSDGGQSEPIVVSGRYKIGDLYYDLSKNQTAEVTYMSYADSTFNKGWNITTANIPASVTYSGTTYSVTSIGGNAFSYCSSLTSVTIPNSVTSIEGSAFYGCSSLTSVTIPNSVTSIGYDAFYNCSSLTSVTIPNSVTSIGGGAFSGCSGLTSVTIPNSVTSIGYEAFTGCSGLTSVTLNSNTIVGKDYEYNPNIKSIFGEQVTEYILGDEITSIGIEAFSGCSSLTSVTIPNSVTSIGGGAFSGCSGLTSVTIPNSVTSIEKRTFYNCSSLTSVTIGNSVTSIGYEAFSGCSSLTSVTLNSNTIVGKDYKYNSNIKSIFGEQVTEYILGDEITSIGNWAFYYCSSLTSVTIGNSVTSIGNNAFSSCSSLTSVTIGNSVTSIGYEAFSGCSGLTSVTIPNSVTSIGNRAFEYCSNLTSVTLNSNTIVGKDYEYNSNIKSIFGEQVTEYILGDEITSIGNEAFWGCSSLTSVTIGNSVASIGGGAFSGCSGLTSVTIPNSVTSIGNRAFEYCSNLTSVTIGNSVTSIGNSAFSGCSSLTSVTIPNSVTSIGGSAFSGCSSLTSVSVEAGNTVYDSRNNCNAIIETSTNTLIFGSKNTTIPNTVTSIGAYAFYYCRGLISIEIPNSVTSIGDGAFEYCYSLTSVTIPNSVTSIGDGAFEYCYSLTSVTIPNSVTSIGDRAFCWCSSLTSVTIPNSVTSIGDGAFEYCYSLTSVTLGTSVKVIEEHAFYDCTAIETITCYSMRPPTVNNGAFENLDYSTIVYVPADYLNTYKMHDFWGIYDVRPIGASKTETTEVKVEPTATTADVVWPAVENAATYELVIKDKNGNVVCTLIFNANGQLTQIAFGAPARNNAAQAAGFAFTVTGLEEGTSYDLTITAKDANEQPIATYSGSFTTTSEGVPTGIDNTPFLSGEGRGEVSKLLRNGEVLIICGGKMYNLQGVEVKLVHRQ